MVKYYVFLWSSHFWSTTRPLAGESGSSSFWSTQKCKSFIQASRVTIDLFLLSPFVYHNM